MSVFATGRLRRYGTELFRAEEAIEARRRERFADTSSRLRGFFAFPDEVTALRAVTRWPALRLDPNCLSQLLLNDDALISARDSEFITRRLLERPMDWADAYLSGQDDADSQHGRLTELVVEGRALVLNTPLREAARTSNLTTWPDSMPLVEFGRIGLELGFDIGYITAWIVDSHPSGRRVRFIMSEGDMRSDRFADAFAAYRAHGGVVDDLALRPMIKDSVRLPDLTPFEFDLP